MNFCWDPAIFEILGFKVSTKTDQINETNYEAKLENKLRAVLKPGRQDNLLPC